MFRHEASNGIVLTHSCADSGLGHCPLCTVLVDLGGRGGGGGRWCAGGWINISTTSNYTTDSHLSIALDHGLATRLLDADIAGQSFQCELARVLVDDEHTLLRVLLLVALEHRLGHPRAIQVWHRDLHLVVGAHLHRSLLVQVHAGWLEVIWKGRRGGKWEWSIITLGSYI